MYRYPVNNYGPSMVEAVMGWNVMEKEREQHSKRFERLEREGRQEFGRESEGNNGR